MKNVCQHGISNLSDLLTVSVSYVLGDSNADDGNDNNGGDGDSDKKLNIVVKLLPHDPFGRYFVTINQFDLREIQFYTKVGGQRTNLLNYCRVHSAYHMHCTCT